MKLDSCLRFVFRPHLESPLDMENYSNRFHNLLHFEEIQMRVDIRKYNLYNQPMTRDEGFENLLVLKVKQILIKICLFIIL